MAGGFVTLEFKDEKYMLNIVGPIDEDINFKVIQFSGPEPLVVNFDGVTGVKSFGIRQFIRWIDSVKNRKISFLNCPKMVVDQMNIVDGFLPHNAVVESFYVPYYCEESGEETSVLFREGIEFDGLNVTLPDGILDSKGNKMEMDAVWSKYFRFLTRMVRNKAA